MLKIALASFSILLVLSLCGFGPRPQPPDVVMPTPSPSPSPESSPSPSIEVSPSPEISPSMTGVVHLPEPNYPVDFTYLGDSCFDLPAGVDRNVSAFVSHTGQNHTLHETSTAGEYDVRVMDLDGWRLSCGPWDREFEGSQVCSGMWRKPFPFANDTWVLSDANLSEHVSIRLLRESAHGRLRVGENVSYGSEVVQLSDIRILAAIFSIYDANRTKLGELNMSSDSYANVEEGNGIGSFQTPDGLLRMRVYDIVPERYQGLADIGYATVQRELILRDGGSWCDWNVTIETLDLNGDGWADSLKAIRLRR